MGSLVSRTNRPPLPACRSSLPTEPADQRGARDVDDGPRSGRPLAEGTGGGHRDRRARPRSRRGHRRRAGLRRLPHRPALPRGRHQRRVPVPARPRGRRASSSRSARTSPRWRPATSSSSTGGPCAASAGPAAEGKPQYCFATHNATQKMTLADGTELSPALGIGAFADKTLVAAGQATKVDPTRRPGRGRPARLRRDGRLRRGGATPAASAWATPSPCSAAAASATPPSPAPRLVGASPIIAVDLDPRKLEWARDVRRHPHRRRRRRSTRSRPSASSPAGSAPTCASRPSATPRCSSRRSSPATWPARSCRSACPTPDMALPDIPMIEFFGRGGALKPVLVRRLPAQPRLPDARRPVPPGPVRPRPLRERAHRHRRRSRRPSTRWSAARCCAPSWCSTDGRRHDGPNGTLGSSGSARTASSRSTARTSTSRTTSGSSATTPRCS